jgi:2-iminoacetate synthase ThiH
MGGKQATSAEVWYTAEKNGMTYEDVLRKLKVIK